MAAAKTTKTEEEIKISVPLKGVHAKLQAARVALMEKGLKKSGENTFANFNFFQLVDFLPEVQKIFTRLGVTTNYTLMPRTIDYVETKEGEIIRKEPIIRDIAKLVIKDIETGETETFEMEAAPVQIGNNTKQNIYQAAGGRSTYYKRYLYRDALEIEESDESDIVLGAPEVNYQAPEQVTPYQFETPQAMPIANAPVNNTPVANQIPTPMPDLQPINIPTTPVVENVTPDAPLTQTSREEVMQLLLGKNLNPLETLMNYCSQKGLVNPSELKESDKNQLVAYINTL